jgi:hydrogenase large subunit
MTERVTFSPISQLSGLLSAEVTLENGRIRDANTSSTMFRGYEWIHAR